MISVEIHFLHSSNETKQKLMRKEQCRTRRACKKILIRTTLFSIE